VIVTIFVSGRYVTVPKLMFSELRDRVDPTVTALSTLLIVFTLVVVALVGVVASVGSRTGIKLVGGGAPPSNQPQD
jgi:ABC-type spermidine/putrescine transport system permease subunit II